MVDATGLAEVEAQAAALRDLLVGLAADAVSLDVAPEMWRAFDRIERLAGAAKVLLARRVDESGGWRSAGCRSAAEYLGRVSGGSVRRAQDMLRASRRLPDAPVVEAALRDGRLSVAQAERIADAAAVDPSAQERLVEAAGRLSLAELGKECGRVKATADPDPEATYGRIREGRRLRQYTAGEGAWCFTGRGTPEDGALFRTALEPLIDEIYAQARREGRQEHRDAYAYDALVDSSVAAPLPAPRTSLASGRRGRGRTRGTWHWCAWISPRWCGGRQKRASCARSRASARCR